MSYLNELYQQIILDHNKAPKNFREMEGANRKAEGYNPLCGDKVTIYLQVEAGTIKDISFQGSGCAISTASASLMTEILKGKTEPETEALFNAFHSLVTGKTEGPDPTERLGKLMALQGVSEFPVRVKCATLVWHTLQAALQEKPQSVSTE
jgi:nitrogen fixation NifU-like protein